MELLTPAINATVSCFFSNPAYHDFHKNFAIYLVVVSTKAIPWTINVILLLENIIKNQEKLAYSIILSSLTSGPGI